MIHTYINTYVYFTSPRWFSVKHVTNNNKNKINAMGIKFLIPLGNSNVIEAKELGDLKYSVMTR